MIILYIGRKQYMYENNQMDLVLERARKALAEGYSIQIIPDA